MKTLIEKYFICGHIFFVITSCIIFPKPQNKYKYLEGQTVRIKYDGSMYESDSSITSCREPYIIKGPHQFPDIKSIYVPAGTEMHVDKMKHVRTIEADNWYAVGKLYINGKIYNCAYGLHHSYLELPSKGGRQTNSPGDKPTP